MAKRRNGRRTYSALEPDEIFIDSQNLMSFDTAHLEGRIERPLTPSVYRGLLAGVVFIALIFLGQTFYLDVVQHTHFETWASENHLRHATILAERGRIIDRNGVPLATNTTVATTTADGVPFVERTYTLKDATAHMVGYVTYPKQDKNGNWYQDETIGVQGAEALFNDTLQGENGVQIAETDAAGRTLSGSVVRAPIQGRDVVLSIDADLQKATFDFVKERVEASFVGGAAAIMDIQTGELLSLVSYPSFDPEIMSSGVPASKVAEYVSDTRSPFVDRAVSGLYTPGSIVKPFIATAALEQNIVTAEKTFVSTGKLVLPNVYDPSKPSVFKDWRAHGVVDMRRAIAVSSDVYFYIVGGGFENQKGLGITNIDKYAALFGFGAHTGYPDDAEPIGTVPNPTWKAEQFNENVWRVGDTYNTSIGQYGWQVTLLQTLRATAAIANNGTLVTPTIVKDGPAASTKLSLDPEHLQIVREGMRRAVSEGTAQTLAIPGFPVAAKTGTAETGERKEFTNSLVIGFFPYDAPRYAFAVILERSHEGTALGAPAVMRKILGWVLEHRPQLTEPAG